MKLRGVGTALVTPFKQDGSVDWDAQRALVEWQIECGIDFLVPCGTTGETPCLNQDEWLQVIKQTIEVAKGRLPIVPGATSNNTAEADSRAKEVASIRVVDVILTASPYYNKPTQEGQYQHYKAIADAVDKPLVLYNVPGRTAANIETATLLRLAKIRNIVAVKEASGSLAQIMDICSQVPEHFAVLSGDDALTLPILSIGGVGLISVASNQIPKELSEMVRAALNNDWATARKLHNRFLPLMNANFIESNPGPVKAVLAMMGRIEENYRLPMVPLRPENRSKLEKIAAEAGILKNATAAR